MCKQYNTSTGCSWVGHFLFLATIDPHVVEKILTSPDCLNKPPVYDAFVEALGGGLLTISAPKCTIHRKMLNPSFNHHILLSFFSIFNHGTDYLNQELDKLVGRGAFDLSRIIYGCTLGISIETTMGLNGSEYRERSIKLLPHTKIVLTTTMNRLLNPWLRIEAIFRLSFVNEVINKKLECRESNEVSKASPTHSNKGGGSDDSVDIKKSRNIFIDHAIDLYKKNHFNWTDFFGESSSMIYAAFGTTATTIHTTLIMLATHPQYQERLYEEILNAFPDKECVVQYEDLDKLVYLDMVINESFRVAATVPFISREAGADVYISEDITIPKGTQLVINIFHMHRNPDVWGPNATLFNPDNFLPENLANKHPYGFIPFSKGSRNCLGWRYGTMLLKVVLAKVIRKYRFSTKFRFEDLQYVINLTLKFKESPQLEVHRR